MSEDSKNNSDKISLSDFFNDKYDDSVLPSFEALREYIEGLNDYAELFPILTKLIAKYELYFIDVDQSNAKYMAEHMDDPLEQGYMIERIDQIDAFLTQRRAELEYFKKKLEYIKSKLSNFGKTTSLKKLYVPLNFDGAALYTGLPKSTIKKNPEKYGADMSKKPYRFYPERLDEVLHEMNLISPYHDYPYLIIRTSDSKGTKEIPKKIYWIINDSNVSLDKLIQYWEDNECIYFDTEARTYYLERFTTDETDNSPGKVIYWHCAQYELVAYLELLSSEGFLSNFKEPNKFINNHFAKPDKKDKNGEDFNIASLTSERSEINNFFNEESDYADAEHNNDDKGIKKYKRLRKIMNEIAELKKI